jgi:hypothetical protein
MKTLIMTSEKFKFRPEMQVTLMKIAPPGYRGINSNVVNSDHPDDHQHGEDMDLQSNGGLDSPKR